MSNLSAIILYQPVSPKHSNIHKSDFLLPTLSFTTVHRLSLIKRWNFSNNYTIITDLRISSSCGTVSVWKIQRKETLLALNEGRGSSNCEPNCEQAHRLLCEPFVSCPVMHMYTHIPPSRYTLHQVWPKGAEDKKQIHGAGENPYQETLLLPVSLGWESG